LIVALTTPISCFNFYEGHDVWRTGGLLRVSRGTREYEEKSGLLWYSLIDLKDLSDDILIWLMRSLDSSSL